MNKVTVLMPVYNDSKYLNFSIRSILNQTYGDFEFLIIDDGSEDNTEEVVSSFSDSRINFKKIIIIKEKIKLCLSLNIQTIILCKRIN
jgi:glycosyltransferase involved in cell wall biosynthesis